MTPQEILHIKGHPYGETLLELKGMDKLEILYNARVNHSWSINEHLGTLRRYGKECEHITEFGVHVGFSTVAFLAARPKKLVGYDVIRQDFDLSMIEKIAREETETVMEFHEKSSLEVDIEETDLLFIDSLHDYDQIRGELFRNGNRARKYIICHDTESRAWSDETPSEKPVQGLLPAINEFLAANPHWVQHEHFPHQSGLTIYRRTE